MRGLEGTLDVKALEKKYDEMARLKGLLFR